ncbi:MAG: DNA primase [Candidatus Portnoybacteria bacterium RBG_13_40_8]|uniref:DNA primase n=1 Tax=Candidatus Portnoybacteria bacterium RBG_13_40_8 TaxID=1801990 RepID=A0A1G2F3C0_9BACT|nr:MAG: DNA primase [Candidatus Portnoybacteria bacterium RBG_13_40_8]OGZ35800.1 MAG: DNA primase [Candidatus Portnoybacteria bacterium RIFCSPHIGHO2_01_FULL_39_19]
MTPIDEIKNRLDIVEVIQDYVKLKKAGKDYKALCPFHKEKNPSFFVSPSKQIWHCFSCNIGGDMFTFVQKIEGVEFADALRILAKKAGVVLKREDPQLKSQRNILYQICEEATEFFQEQLQKNKAVQDYLKNRGLENKTIEEFKIGYAMDSWDALYKHLTELGYKESDIEKAGFLAKKETSNKYYDRFRNRIMFPIFDLSGQAAGFSGRIFGKEDEKKAKYVNSPDTLIYNKSRIIYGLDKAKMEIRQKNQCVIVEGQFDLIMAHQAGSKNAIATSGSALTIDQLHILKRYAENLVFSFDADTGGESATKRAVAPAQQLEFNVRVAILPVEDKDPAEIIKKDKKKWENILENSKPIMEFYFENAFSKYQNLTVDNKREIAKELLYPIKNITNVVEQAHWLQALASRLKIDERKLVEALQKIKARESGEEIPSTPETRQVSRIKSLEEHLLGLVLKYSQHLDFAKEELNPNILIIPEVKNVFVKLKSFKESFDLKSFQKELSPEEVYLTNYLIFKVEYCELEEKEVLDEIRCAIKEIKIYNLRDKMSQVSLDIKEAEENKDKEKIEDLKRRFYKLTEELNEINI